MYSKGRHADCLILNPRCRQCLENMISVAIALIFSSAMTNPLVASRHSALAPSASVCRWVGDLPRSILLSRPMAVHSRVASGHFCLNSDQFDHDNKLSPTRPMLSIESQVLLETLCVSARGSRKKAGMNREKCS